MSRKARYVLVILISLLFLNPGLDSSSGLQKDHQDLGEAIQKFEQYVEQRMPTDQIPGLSIGFMKNDFTWAKGFGYSDLENKVKAKPQSSYRMASVSKTFTAIAVLKLMEEGRIDLDEQVQIYVPYFPKKKWPVTIRQVLGHLGGISHYKDYDIEGHFKNHMNTKQAISVFKDFELVAEPGTEYNYSSYGFNLLGAVIEEASGQSYGDYITENIFQPLGMTDSRMESSEDLIPHRVQGYRLINSEIKNSEFVDISSRFAAGGTRSTVIDLLKYGKGICEEKILQPETWNMIFSTMATAEGQSTWYGMGWSVSPLKGHFRVGHSGSQPETRTQLLIFPTENFAIAAGTNLERANLMPYVNVLCELVLKQDLNSKAFVPDPHQQAVYNSLSQVFDYGLSRYQYFGPQTAGSRKQISQAFTYFNKHARKTAVKSDFEQTQSKLKNGIHPSEGKPFIRIGAHMAAYLEKAYGKSKLQEYHLSGPLTFFKDYIRLASDYRFRSEIIQTVHRLHDDWERSYTDQMRTLHITADTDFDALLEKLKQLSKDSSIYPDFSEEITEASYTFIKNNQIDKAMSLLNTSSVIYPGNTFTLLLLGECYVLKNEAENAFKFYKESHSLDPIDVDHFGFFAEKLEQAKKTQELLLLIDIALRIYPKNPEVHKQAGYIYLKQEKKELAVKMFQKSLKLNPKQAEVKDILNKLQKK
ncbi:MAG: serine hydrolase [Candidatus Aminicenantes bacterium]|nr:serine hydrolase [Candidatus Aminicenantes bacterium]